MGPSIFLSLSNFLRCWLCYFCQFMHIRISSPSCPQDSVLHDRGSDLETWRLSSPSSNTCDTPQPRKYLVGSNLAQIPAQCDCPTSSELTHLFGSSRGKRAVIGNQRTQSAYQGTLFGASPNVCPLSQAKVCCFALQVMIGMVFSDT